MFLLGILFNPMNILAYKLNQLYLSLTLVYGGLLMATNMIWGHEIIHYLVSGHFNWRVFCIGLMLSIFVSVVFLRHQFMVDDNQWLKRMISHHSTALTTSEKIRERSKNKQVIKLADEIINTQEREIKQMKNLIIK
jgi:hypothetical protein